MYFWRFESENVDNYEQNITLGLNTMKEMTAFFLNFR